MLLLVPASATRCDRGAALPAQANYKSWMNDSWEKLNGEVVEREVTNAYKVSGKY